MRTVKFTLESLVELSSVRLLLPPDLRAPEKRAAVAENIKEAVRRCASVVEIISVVDMILTFFLPCIIFLLDGCGGEPLC